MSMGIASSLHGGLWGCRRRPQFNTKALFLEGALPSIITGISNSLRRGNVNLRTAALALALLGTTVSLGATTCTPSSATITYAADDYFYFYLNGNEVVSGNQFDAGAPPATVTIPLADFAPAGSDNYFAFEDKNTVAALLSCTWIITISCGGSNTYLTPADTSLSMYDDTTGGNVPGVESGLSWFQQGYPDTGNLFSGTPVDVTASLWYQPLNNPSTGSAVPIISWDASSDQHNTGEIIYYRENLVLPTPPPTPTPYPTVCGAIPAFVQSSILATGCAGNGSPTSFSYTIPSDPGEILLVQQESTGPVLSGVTWDGLPLTQLPGSPYTTSGPTIYTYYLVNPPAGTFMLNLNTTSGCSWNPVATVFDNVNPASPIGATNTSTGNAYGFKDTITTVSPYSIIDDFFAYANGPYAFSSTTGSPLFPVNNSGCCDAVYGSYYNAEGPGPYSLYYTQATSPQTWWGQSIELEAVTACGTPTDTPTPAPTPTSTALPTATFTPPPTNTPGPSPTDTETLTPSPTRSWTPTETESYTPGPTATITPTSNIIVAALDFFGAFPNPAPPTGTVFGVGIPGPGTISIVVYTLKGEKVATLTVTKTAQGIYEIPWDLKNTWGAKISFGSYYVIANYSDTQGGHTSQGLWITVLR
jgi:hypothetical protein